MFQCNQNCAFGGNWSTLIQIHRLEKTEFLNFSINYSLTKFHFFFFLFIDCPEFQIICISFFFLVNRQEVLVCLKYVKWNNFNQYGFLSITSNFQTECFYNSPKQFRFAI